MTTHTIRGTLDGLITPQGRCNLFHPKGRAGGEPAPAAGDIVIHDANGSPRAHYRIVDGAEVKRLDGDTTPHKAIKGKIVFGFDVVSAPEAAEAEAAAREAERNEGVIRTRTEALRDPRHHGPLNDGRQFGGPMNDRCRMVGQGMLVLDDDLDVGDTFRGTDSRMHHRVAAILVVRGEDGKPVDVARLEDIRAEEAVGYKDPEEDEAGDGVSAPCRRCGTWCAGDCAA